GRVPGARGEVERLSEQGCARGGRELELKGLDRERSGANLRAALPSGRCAQGDRTALETSDRDRVRNPGHANLDRGGRGGGPTECGIGGFVQPVRVDRPRRESRRANLVEGALRRGHSPVIEGGRCGSGPTLRQIEDDAAQGGRDDDDSNPNDESLSSGELRLR